MNNAPCQGEIEKAVRLLRNGGVVAFPTDTLYGLGADVFSIPALERIFLIKGRPANMALPVLIADWDQLGGVAEPMPDVGFRLAQRFWPGPLTLVLRRLPQLPGLVTGGALTVAVRMPAHPMALALASGLGSPITGTSANRSGQPDLPDLDSLAEQLGQAVDYMIRSGPVPGGVASTVVDITEGKPCLVREGALSFEQVLEASK